MSRIEDFVRDLRSAQEAEADYLRTGNLARLDEAVAAWDRIVREHLTESAPTQARVEGWNACARVHLRRYEARGNGFGDVEIAVERWRDAVATDGARSPVPAYVHTNYGLGLRCLFLVHRRVPDLEAALGAFRRALELTPARDLHRATSLSNLGLGLRDHHKETGSVRSLTDAVRAYREAADCAPRDWSDRPSVLTNLGLALLGWSEKEPDQAIVEEAVSALREAVNRTPAGSLDGASRLTNLGLGLRERYRRTGALGDLEEAIDSFRRAVEATADRDEALPTYLNNLGLGLSTRYDRTRSPEDLEAALAAHRRALAITPAKHQGRPMFLNDLGSVLWKRYERGGVSRDLDEALEAFREALEAAPPRSPERPMFQTNLGVGLAARSRARSSLPDQEEAVKAFRAALDGMPPDSPGLPRYFSNLGSGLRDLARRRSEGGRLSEATEAYCRAVALAPPDSPDRPEYLASLGDALRAAGESGEALRCYDEALSVLEGALLESPVAYQLGQQERWEGLAASAVEANVQCGQPARALTIAEGHKSRLLTGLLSRGPLTPPPSLPAGLVAAEAELARRLADHDAVELARHGLAGPVALPGSSAEGSLAPRLALLGELRPLWREMERFGDAAVEYVRLRRGDRIGWEDVTGLVAAGGPGTAWLSLFRTGTRTLLFLMRHGWQAPEVIELALDAEGWRALMDDFVAQVQRRADAGSAAETWHERLGPGLTRAIARLEGAEVAVFVPGAHGHLLPWSALLSCTLGSIPVVTAPSLALLARLGRRAPVPGGEALVVGDSLGDLPHAAREAREVAATLGTEPLVGKRATRAAVLERLSAAGHAHFATHAYFADGSPLDSGVVLADGVISARDLLRQGIRAPRFLALSACQSGVSGTLGGDEVAGLTQAFLYAGASCILASLWPVDDPATAALMTRFYAEWKGQGVPRAVALRSAMDAIRRESSWARTHYWGAFGLVGEAR